MTASNPIFLHPPTHLALCIDAGCSAYLLIGTDPDTEQFIAQHGANPEHRRAWPYASRWPQRTAELKAWLQEIHQREQPPATLSILDPATGEYAVAGQVTNWSIE